MLDFRDNYNLQQLKYSEAMAERGTYHHLANYEMACLFLFSKDENLLLRLSKLIADYSEEMELSKNRVTKRFKVHTYWNQLVGRLNETLGKEHADNIIANLTHNTNIDLRFVTLPNNIVQNLALKWDFERRSLASSHADIEEGYYQDCFWKIDSLIKESMSHLSLEQEEKRTIETAIFSSEIARNIICRWNELYPIYAVITRDIISPLIGNLQHISIDSLISSKASDLEEWCSITKNEYPKELIETLNSASRNI